MPGEHRVRSRHGTLMLTSYQDQSDPALVPVPRTLLPLHAPSELLLHGRLLPLHLSKRRPHLCRVVGGLGRLDAGVQRAEGGRYRLSLALACRNLVRLDRG